MKRRTPYTEPGFVSLRTDAASAAEAALASLLQGIPLDERQQGYVREALESAFADGEQQGEFRALWVLTLAEQHATRSPLALKLIRRCLHLLAPDVQEWA